MSKCFCVSAEVSAFVATVTSPVHAVTNTYETNRDVLLTKQNTATVGPNANSTVSQYTYAVNSLGQRVSRQQSGLAFGTATTDAFSYNARGEVTNSTNTLTPSANRAYSYDPIGNRLFATEGTTSTPSTNPTSKTYASNSLNQYTQISTDTPSAQPPQTTASPTYDLDGNMLSDGTGKLYTWDAENRLIQVTLANGEIVKYFYDSNSRRIKREHITATTPITTTTTLYLYDSWNVISEKTAVPNTEMSPATKTYHWGLDLSNALQSAGGVGGLLRTTYRPPTADDTPSVHQLHYHLYDANGNTCELISSTGAITAHYEYDPFGKELLSTASFASENTYRFSTKSLDTATQLHYYGYRFFDVNLGRWINRYPMGELGHEVSRMGEGILSNINRILFFLAVNSHSFSINDPLAKIDVNGRFAIAIPLIFPITIPISIPIAIPILIGVGTVACMLIPRCTEAVGEFINDVTKPKVLPHPPPRLCPPCNPPAGEKFNKTTHTDHDHGDCLKKTGCKTHWHYQMMNQNPLTCQCFLERHGFGGCGVAPP